MIIIPTKPRLSLRSYVPNGLFEADVTGWTAGASTSIAQTQSDAFEGTSSMLVTATAAAGLHAIFLDTAADNLIGGTLGQTFAYLLRVKGLGTTIGKTYRLRLAERGGLQAQANMSADTNFVMPADWTFFIKTGTIAQNDRTQVSCQVVSLTTPASGEQYLVDAIRLIRLR